MFKREPFSGLDENKVSPDEVIELMRTEMRKTTIHYGEGRLNPATIACVIAEVEEQLMQKYEA